MVKGEGFSLVSTDEQPRPSTVRQIFREAAKLLWRSRKPMLAILLILLLPLQALLFFGMDLVITPLITDMTMKFFTMKTKDPRTLEYNELLVAALKDARELTGAEVALMLISFLSSACFIMAAVQTVAMASKGEQATLKGLLCRIGRTWKGPVVAQLYVVLISFGYMALLLLMIGAFAIFSTGSMAALALGGVLVILALLLLLYLRMVWSQGLVISVVEEGCSGLAALGRASELIRGRRRLAFNLSLFLLLLTFVISMVYYFVHTRVPAGGAIQLIGGLVAIPAGLLMSALALAVHVVFYHECKKSRGDQDVAAKESLLYTRLHTAPTVDEALP